MRRSARAPSESDAAAAARATAARQLFAAGEVLLDPAPRAFVDDSLRERSQGVQVDALGLR
jgi:hypothetical protein